MPASLAPTPSSSEVSKYWDQRHPVEYHTDPNCRVGRWIPVVSVARGDTHAGRPCASCVEHDEDATVTLLFAI